MTYIELVGVPASGKTTKALQLLKDNKYLYSGRRSLKYKSQIQKISFFGLPKQVNIFYLFIQLPKDIFFTLSFLFDIRGSIKIKFLNSISILFLIQKSRALSISKINFILDQGIQQFLLDCYFKKIISLKSVKRFSSKLSNKKYRADKYLFLSCDLKEMRLRISKSNKHIKQLENEDITIYCKKYLLAFEEMYMK